MTYRVGNHQPQNVYRDDAYIGVMFTAEDAALAVEALNGTTTPSAPISARIRALIFNGVTHASSASEEETDWIRLSERERIAHAVYDELRRGNIEFRLGPLALLAEAAEQEAQP